MELYYGLIVLGLVCLSAPFWAKLAGYETHWGCLISRSSSSMRDRRACGLRFDDQQAQTFTPFVHPLSRHCGEADYALHARCAQQERVKFSYERRTQNAGVAEVRRSHRRCRDRGGGARSRRLFERAAWGMFSVTTDVAAARATETSRISIDAPDRVALLVRWLSELNYRHVTEHRRNRFYHEQQFLIWVIGTIIAIATIIVAAFQ
jgi:hypothetical protein